LAVNLLSERWVEGIGLGYEEGRIRDRNGKSPSELAGAFKVLQY